MSMHMQTGPDGKTWGWYNTKNDEFEPILCWVCDQPFTEQSWEERHTDAETANDVHEHCCVDCNHELEVLQGTRDHPIIANEAISRGYDVVCPACGQQFSTFAKSVHAECEHCYAILDLSGAIHAYD